MGTVSQAPRWADHVQGGVTFSVKHLWPTMFAYTVPAVAPTKEKPGKAERKYRIHASYSHHCFSTDVGARGTATPPPDELYEDLSRRGRDVRWFCPHRWQLSQALPAIVTNIAKRHCYEAGARNYLTVELGAAHLPGDYVVYFRTERWQDGDGTC